MFTLGFDVSKNTLDGALVNRSGQVADHYVVANNPRTISALLKRIHARHPKLVIGCEATGQYHLVLLRTCLQLWLQLQILNPIIMKQYIRATIRGRKTDRDDAVGIARLTLRGEGRTATIQDLSLAKLYVRLATKITQQYQALALQQQFLAAVALDGESSTSFQPALDCLDALATNLRSMATELVDQTDVQLLQSIVGVGPLVATSVLAEIGSISQFPSSRQLIAFAGFDPKVKQSGTSLKRNTKLTKRGSPELRRVLFIAANSARRYDPELHAVYERKRSAGKAHTPSTIVVVHKMINRIYAVLKRGTPYTVHRT